MRSPAEFTPAAHGNELETASHDPGKQRNGVPANRVEERSHRHLVCQFGIQGPAPHATQGELTEDVTGNRFSSSAPIRRTDGASQRPHLPPKRALCCDEIRSRESRLTHPLVRRFASCRFCALDQSAQARRGRSSLARLDDLARKVQCSEHRDVQRVDRTRPLLDPPHRRIHDLGDLREELGALVAANLELLPSNPHSE